MREGNKFTVELEGKQFEIQELGGLIMGRIAAKLNNPNDRFEGYAEAVKFGLVSIDGRNVQSEKPILLYGCNFWPASMDELDALKSETLFDLGTDIIVGSRLGFSEAKNLISPPVSGPAASESSTATSAGPGMTVYELGVDASDEPPTPSLPSDTGTPTS